LAVEERWRETGIKKEGDKQMFINDLRGIDGSGLVLSAALNVSGGGIRNPR